MPPPLHESTYRDGASMADRQMGLLAAEATLEFGRFRVLLRRRQLLADGQPIDLGTRAFDLLAVLLEADGLVVTKDEILHRVWPGRIVGENNLHVQISALRKALGPDRDLIRTDSGRGYRLTVPVRAVAPASVCPETTRQRTRSGHRPARPRNHPPRPHGWFAVSPAGWRRL
jgi:DNA-binding winged helix-turn-helix (wHTH) protein